MENKFFVTTCRFHTKVKNKLLIVGWFYQNGVRNNQLLVCLDRKKLPFTMEKVDMGRSTLKTKDGILITKQYFLWIDLPKSWRECKKLEVKNFYHGVGNTAFSVPVSNLKNIEGIMQRFIDSSVVEEDGFEISGWYIQQGGIELSVADGSGQEYPVEMKQKDRPDVRKMYPENTEEEVVGFVASYKGSVPKKVRVQFEDADRYEETTVTLLSSPVQKGAAAIGTAYRKALVYYQQFGITATVFRALDKLSGREAISYKAWLKRHSPSAGVLKLQREKKFAFSPKISIVVPLYKTPETYLVEMIESVRNQSYRNWELCLSDGSGEGSPIAHILKKYEQEDERIKVVYNKEQLRISENTNEALKVCTGDYIAFADHDDLLAPNALYECVYLLNKDPETEILYTDEDKIDMNGKEHFMPHFKSDFNIDMLCSTNYICHLFVVKRDVYEKAGMLNPEFDGAQDYDFVLRCVEKSDKIRHIPRILYHWRAHKNSTAENPESKNYAFVAGRRAIQAHYDRMGIPAEVEETEYKGIYRSKYRITDNPLISVIIPNKDHIADLEKCICSLEEKNRYQNLEIIVVENNSEEEETFAYYKELEQRYPNVKVLFWEEKVFNYPAINNFGAEHASGEYLLFLNNDTEVVNEDCIEELLGYCQRSDVGAVGARLYYDDGTIQHAGVIVGLGGIAGHPFSKAVHEDPGYFGRIIMAQDYSAVTAACMLVKKSVFQQVEGFDQGYAVAFNDVDLCLRIRKAGYLIVYNPYAEMNHYESKSRGYEDTEEKVKRFNSEISLFEKRWKKFLEHGDPYYNPNLTLDDGNFGLNLHAN
ncbi:MAG: glycosyltransferase [Ruminococcus sp.]|jgi:GT2 family glycosyltransferase|nr:glycosyltransferase [Ruminococcus sp.]